MTYSINIDRFFMLRTPHFSVTTRAIFFDHKVNAHLEESNGTHTKPQQSLLRQSISVDHFISMGIRTPLDVAKNNHMP